MVLLLLFTSHFVYECVVAVTTDYSASRITERLSNLKKFQGFFA